MAEHGAHISVSPGVLFGLIHPVSDVGKPLQEGIVDFLGGRDCGEW